MLLKRIFLLIVMMMGLAGTASATDANFRPKLGCIPFQATSLQAMAFTENISTSLLNNLDNSRFFDLVERKTIEQFSVIEGLSIDNLDFDGISRIGSTARLDYVVYGTVNTSETSGVVLDINMMRVSSRKLLLKEKISMSESDYSGKLLAIASSIVDHAKNAGKPVDPEPVSTAPVVVAPPRRVTASGTSSSIRIEWQHANQQSVNGYNIYRSSTLDGQYTLYTTTTEPFFIDENMKLNETFYYRIAAVGQTGISEMSPPVKGATAIAPPAPIFMNIEADIKGARLFWRPRPGSGGQPGLETAEYQIYRRKGETGTFSPIVRLPVSTTTYYDNTLADGEKYLYTITSRNSEGTESEYSAKLSIQPMATPGPVKAVNGRIRTVPVTWNACNEQTGDGYVLYRSDTRDGHYSPITRIKGLKETEFIDTGLKDNSTYWYRVTVFNKEGIETDLSEPASALTRNVPPAPLQLTAVSGEPRQVTLHWKTAGTVEDEIRQYIILRTTDAKSATLETIGEISSKYSDFIDRDPPLGDKTTYYYRICSQNSSGAVSPQSEIASATTKAPPHIPAGLTADSGGIRKILIHWNRNPETDIKVYQLFRKRSDENEFSEIAKVDTLQFEDNALSNGSEASYRIRAIDSDKLMSSLSESVTARTKPLPAIVAGFRADNQGKRIVSWNANHEKDVHNYTIYKKGFLGTANKLGTTRETTWKLDEIREKVEVYVTAVDDTGLESEPSVTVTFE